jgi:hypothetical protein
MSKTLVDNQVLDIINGIFELSQVDGHVCHVEIDPIKAFIRPEYIGHATTAFRDDIPDNDIFWPGFKTVIKKGYFAGYIEYQKINLHNRNSEQDIRQDELHIIDIVISLNNYEYDGYDECESPDIVVIGEDTAFPEYGFRVQRSVSGIHDMTQFVKKLLNENRISEKWCVQFAHI